MLPIIFLLKKEKKCLKLSNFVVQYTAVWQELEPELMLSQTPLKPSSAWGLWEIFSSVFWETFNIVINFSMQA